MHDQQSSREMKSPRSLHSIEYEKELKEIKEVEYEHSSSLFHKDESVMNTDDTQDTATSSITAPSKHSTLMSIESTRSTMTTWNSKNNYDPYGLSFVFKFDPCEGELGPNEKRYLTLSFCPLENVLFTVNATLSLACKDFPEIMNILPVVVKGSGCKTQFKVIEKRLMIYPLINR